MTKNKSKKSKKNKPEKPAPKSLLDEYLELAHTSGCNNTEDEPEFVKHPSLDRSIIVPEEIDVCPYCKEQLWNIKGLLKCSCCATSVYVSKELFDVYK